MKHSYLPFLHTTGIACPLFSLRYENDYGIGDIRGGYGFIEFLSANKLQVWRLLPLNSVTISGKNNPYLPDSAFSFDPIYIDLTDVQELSAVDLTAVADVRIKLHGNNIVQYSEIWKVKDSLLKNAYQRFVADELDSSSERGKAFRDYVSSEYEWLSDYAFFKAVEERLGSIPKWSEELKTRDRDTVQEYRELLHDEIQYQEYLQWLCTVQWQKLHSFATEKGVFLFGDIPFYVGVLSSDVWTRKEEFMVHSTSLEPLCFGGTPPDDFAEDGQLWAESAVYRWSAMKKSGYTWWKRRLLYWAKYFDGLRLDHFRGFIAYWEVLAGESAGSGLWVKGPGHELLHILFKEVLDQQLCMLCIENLGTITDDVIRESKMLGAEGYHVFCYEYPEMLRGNVSFYANAETTVHDTLPLVAWWMTLPAEERNEIAKTVGVTLTSDDIDHLSDELRWLLLYKINSYPFRMKIFPIADILGLKERINTPGIADENLNWNFRMPVTIETLMQDKPLIERLQKFPGDAIVGRGLEAVPYAAGVLRDYKIGEMAMLWVLDRKKEDITISLATDMPVIGGKELVFTFVEESIYGNLYRLQFKPAKAGLYVTNLKTKDLLIGSYIFRVEQ